MRLLKLIFKFLIGCVLFSIVMLIIGYFYYAKDLPNVAELRDIRLQTPMRIFSADGDLIATFGERRRIPVAYEAVPDYIIKAIVATEDSRFFEHHGVDPVGILRAAFIALKSGGFSQGGSTITQQVAKNFFLTPERHISRKIREMILAIRMEKELSKKEILTLYLNKIYFGSRSYGIGAAAFTFFGKTADQLTLSESALLAGLPNAPSAYNPLSYPNKAKSRRNWVLHRMLDQGYITQEQYNQATEEPLNVSYHTPVIAFSAPYIAEMARQYMYERFGENAYSDGYDVYTTITRKNQIAANEAVHNHIINYDMRHGYRGPERILWKPTEAVWNTTQIKQALSTYINYGDIQSAAVIAVKDDSAEAILSNGKTISIPFEGVSWARRFITDTQQGALPTKISQVLKTGQQIWVRQVEGIWWLSQLPSVNSALVSLNPETGEIKALVGGFNFQMSKFNRAAQAIRQIGSNIKPFIYTAALDKGITMATILNDAPIMRTNAGSEVWRPKNSPAKYDGPLRLRVGLALSKNVMMVRAVRAIGIDYVAEYLERFGFPKENISHNESLALGSASFTPLQVARAYSVIANGGYLITPYLINEIKFAEGITIYKHTPEIICRSCPDQFSDLQNDDKKTEISLDNVENAVDSPDNQEPENSQLSAESGLVIADPNKQYQAPPEITINDKNSATNFETNQSYAPHVINSKITYLIRSGLKTTVNGELHSSWLPTAWRSRSLNRSDVGGKTGTTNQSKDVWFSGFGDNLVTTVWMGFDDHRRELGKAPASFNKPSAISFEGGAKTANPLWNDYMKIALENEPIKEDPKPDGIVEVLIDKRTGLLAYSKDNAITEYFIEGTEPKVYAQREIGTQVVDDEGNSSELF